MADPFSPSGFLSLPRNRFPSPDDFDDFPSPFEQPTLHSVFDAALRQRSTSPAAFSSPHSMPDRLQNVLHPAPQPLVDLRSLDYISEYDSHLMCPICHVPFVHPVVLDCDHTFCSSCYEEYREGTIGHEQPQCPSCRTQITSIPRKASRLISNMCNDIRVKCPNAECTTITARGYIEWHVEKDCLEQHLDCPDTKCDKQTKRKNFVHRQCIHNSHIECDCGAVIELGRGDWLRHKDEDCPTTTVPCVQCGGRIPVKDYLAGSKNHHCDTDPSSHSSKCPGEEYGCRLEDDDEDLSIHILSCPLARLAPYLKQQAQLLNSLSEQVAQTKIRNEILETGLERINTLLTTQIQPKLDHLQFTESDHDHDIEEIHRDHIPGAAAIHHRDLLLPAHLRDLTPSPTFSHTQPHHPPSTWSIANSQQHLLALHETLRQSVAMMESDMTNLHNNMTELDARTSMQQMNETLRLREELAHVNAALFSTRSQVQWLLNRERMNMGMARGRPPVMPSSQSQSQIQTQSQSQPQGQTTTIQSQVNPNDSSSGSAIPQPIDSSFPFGAEVATSSTGSNNGSAATSPLFQGINSASTRRPSIRRLSGGSQERVKL